MRSHNLALALRVVTQADGPVSRTGIARTTGLTRASASTLVDALVAGGLLREVPLPPTARSGRPATGLVPSPTGPLGLGLAVDVDALAVCLVGLDGTVHGQEVLAGNVRGRPPEEVLARLTRAARQLVDGAPGPVCGATVALPGLVHPDGERLLRAPNLGWHDVPVLELLRRGDVLADLPLALDNEADLAALAEAGRSAGDFVYLSGEVGIGAGLVLDGTLHRGARGWSGEVGHLTVDRLGPRCGCGARGCLEQYAGTEVLLRRAGLPGPATGSGAERLVEQALRGRRPVLTALDRAGHALGLVLAGVVNLLDLDEVVLGGSLGPLAPWLTPPIEAELREHVLWAGLQVPTVRAATSGRHAVVVGAGLAAGTRVRDDPGGWLARTPARGRRDQIVS